MYKTIITFTTAIITFTAAFTAAFTPDENNTKRTMSAPSKSFTFSKSTLKSALSQKSVKLSVKKDCVFGAAYYIPGDNTICVTPTSKDLSFKEKAVHEAVHVLQLRKGFTDGAVMPSSLEGCKSNLTKKQEKKVEKYPPIHQPYEKIAYGLQENAECVLKAFYQ